MQKPIHGLSSRCRRLLALTGSLLACPALLADGTAPASATARETRWTMINVSPREAQADCHLLEFPDGRTVLIDIADAADAPGSALGYLQSHQVQRIDLVVISHFHKDHYGRLRDLIATGIAIGRVAGNLPALGDNPANAEAPWGFDRAQSGAVLELLRQKNIPYFTPAIGERLIEVKLPDGGVAALDVVCLYDGVRTPVGPTDTNDTSILLRLSHGPTRALFTGDLNHRLGIWLAGSGLDLAADLLKVPHHGIESCAPDEFFARVGPKAALVPTSRSLWFSKRSQRIRDYFARQNIPTYVSGVEGNVTVLMSTAGFTIQSARK